MKESQSPVIDWLLSGDVSVQYQTRRDLLGDARPNLQNRIAKEGWGHQFLACRNADGTWGEKFYFPKWTATHYTLLDLRNLQIAPATRGICGLIQRVIATHKAADGGLGHRPDSNTSDVCVNGMFLNYASYFGTPETDLSFCVDYLLTEVMMDGGFNCMRSRSGAHHSSMHSTLSVLEGILAYQKAGHSYRLDELNAAAASSRAFLLKHHLFKSDRTGRIIHSDFLKMPYPSRWRYNVLRALDYFRAAAVPFDPHMTAGLGAIEAKQRADGKWPRQAALPGKVHFVMEPARAPGRWNTLIALRVLNVYPDG